MKICQFCLETKENTSKFACGHIFCLHCIDTLTGSKLFRCPVCAETHQIFTSSTPIGKGIGTVKKRQKLTETTSQSIDMNQQISYLEYVNHQIAEQGKRLLSRKKLHLKIIDEKVNQVKESIDLYAKALKEDLIGSYEKNKETKVYGLKIQKEIERRKALQAKFLAGELVEEDDKNHYFSLDFPEFSPEFIYYSYKKEDNVDQEAIKKLIGTIEPNGFLTSIKGAESSSSKPVYSNNQDFESYSLKNPAP